MSKSKPCTEATAAAKPGMPPVYYRLHSLLHTLRAVECQQDTLCSLLAEIQRTGKLNAAMRRELEAILHDVPAALLNSEVQSVWSELERAA